MSPQTSGPALILLRDGRSYAASEAQFEDGILHAQARLRQLVGSHHDREVLLAEERGYSFPRDVIREVRWGAR